VHEGEKPHACPQCPKTFSQAGNRDVHVRAVHEGIKAHVCPQCDLSFSQASNLKKHVEAVHEGKKPHACPQCDRAFSHASSLKKHVEAVHEGKKPHVCPQCGHAFAQAGQLKCHVAVVHEGIKPFVCEKCMYPFAFAREFKRHVASCGLYTSSQRAAISSNGCYAFREREISKADRGAEQLVASAVGGDVPVLHRDANAEQKNDWNARVDAKVLQLAEAFGGGPLAAYIGSTHAEGLLIDPETRSIPADDPRLVKCLTRRVSTGSQHYTIRNEKGEWVFAAREYPPPGAGNPVPALIPIAVSFDPTSNTTVTEGRLVRQGHKGQGYLFLNPPNFNAGSGLKMAKYGSVLYLLPTTGNVKRAEVVELLGKLRETNNKAGHEKRATKRQQKQSSEDELSHSSTLEGDSQG
jgi:hypothetical protein